MDLRDRGLYIHPEILQLDDLTPREMMVLAKIVSLHEHQSCWAGDKSLGELVGVSRQGASYIVQKLRDKGYISVDSRRENSKRITERTITPNGRLASLLANKQAHLLIPDDEQARSLVKEASPLAKTPKISKPTREVVKKERVEREKKELQGESGRLFKWIMAGCEKVHKGPFKNYGQQGKAVKQLLITAEKMAPREGMTVKEWVETYMHLAFKLWEADEFWHKQAFSPSLVNGSTFFDRVMETAKETTGAGLEDLAKEMFK